MAEVTVPATDGQHTSGKFTVTIKDADDYRSMVSVSNRTSDNQQVNGIVRIFGNRF